MPITISKGRCDIVTLLVLSDQQSKTQKSSNREKQQMWFAVKNQAQFQLLNQNMRKIIQ